MLYFNHFHSQSNYKEASLNPFQGQILVFFEHYWSENKLRH